MIAGLRRLQATPVYTRVLDWAKLISITGSAQMLVQALGFISGILVIRLLPTEEYGLYTIANTMLGTMTLLSDGGISTGVMAQGGKVWQDKEKLGVVLATGLDLRRKFAFVSLVIALPILVYLLLHHGASFLAAALVALSLIPTFFASLSDGLLQIVPKLNQSITPLQKNQLVVSGWRLALSAFLLFIFPFTYIAVLANGLPRVYGNIQLRKIAHEFADPHQKPSRQIRSEILGVVRRVLPGAIYYCMSGQVTIWLVSFFGSSKSIAQLGAVGRFSMIFTLFGAVVGTLVIPRFARMEEDKRKLLKRFFQIFSIATLLSLSILLFFWLFGNQVLFILGKQYANLSYELFLSIAGSCIAFVWGVVYLVCSNRGWIINPTFTIISSILALACGLYLFDFSTVIGVLYLNIFVALVELTYHTGYTLYRILRIK